VADLIDNPECQVLYEIKKKTRGGVHGEQIVSQKVSLLNLSAEIFQGEAEGRGGRPDLLVGGDARSRGVSWHAAGDEREEVKMYLGAIRRGNYLNVSNGKGIPGSGILYPI